MSSRWFIPGSLAIFSGFFGVIWLYLAATQEPVHSSPVASVQESPLDQEIDGLMTRSRERGPQREPPRTNQTALPAQRRRAPAGPSLRQIAWRMSDRLDEASVQFRSDIGKTAIVQEAEGLHAAAAGDHEAALRHLDRALAKNPRDTAALTAKADSLVALERFEEAAQVYKDVAHLSPSDTAARYNYAVVLYRLTRFDDAVHELREVVRLRPDHADAQYNLASLAQRDGRLTESREAWQAFTRLRPEVPSGWFNLGVVNMDFDDSKTAADAFARFTELRPTDPDGWVNLALAEASSGQLESALYALTTADDLSPCEAITLDLLAQVHELLAERDPSTADTHLAAAAEIRDLIGKPTQNSNGPIETIAAGEKN